MNIHSAVPDAFLDLLHDTRKPLNARVWRLFENRVASTTNVHYAAMFEEYLAYRKKGQE